MDGIEKAEFVKLFDKNLVFVLAVSDTAQIQRDMKDNVEKFGSNIAKFSLAELVKGMKGIDVDFEFTQILRETN